MSVPAVGVALLLLSGCSGSGLPPGTASDVNGTRITTTRVSDVAAAQCDLRDVLTKKQLAPAITAAQVNRESLSLLMDTELTKQFGASEDFKPDPLLSEAFLGRVQPLFTDLPADSKALMTEVFTVWADTRSILVEAGSDATGQKPTFSNADKLLEAGLQLREKWLKNAVITTDPRYAPDKDGYPSRDSASVSKARSTFAVDSEKETPSPAFLSGLPPNQKCG
jgi:hypothetical protein